MNCKVLLIFPVVFASWLQQPFAYGYLVHHASGRVDPPKAYNPPDNGTNGGSSPMPPTPPTGSNDGSRRMF